jgi:hypothetical protein
MAAFARRGDRMICSVYFVKVGYFVVLLRGSLVGVVGTFLFAFAGLDHAPAR